MPLSHRAPGRPEDTELRVRRVDPWTGRLLGTVPVGGADVVTSAVDAAHTTAPAWASLTAQERADMVRHGADRLERIGEEVARLNSREMGKPLPDAHGGVRSAIATARQYAELGPLHRGRSLQGSPSATDTMRHVPRGVVAVVVPWNDPVAIAVQGLTAALVTGNTVVMKPSERAAFSVDAAMAAFDHLPPGVLSVVHGDASTGRLLAADPQVDVVLLTGSIAAGRDVLGVTAQRGARAVLELGGNDPLVIDRGVDPVWAAQQAATGSFANAGQICVSTERIYVHRAVADEVIAALVAEAGCWQPGDPLLAATRMGPLVDDAHRQAVHEQVCDAVDRGARSLTGGVLPPGPGSAYPPTVLVDVPPDARVLADETFGPVAPVVVAASWDEAIGLASSGHHGLSATVLTSDPGHMMEAAERLRVGTVKVNDVFGGAPGGAAHPRGASGNALGYGPELLDELSAVQVVHLQGPGHASPATGAD